MSGSAGEEIFTIPARRCRRCGGLLTSAQAIKDGYGHVCKMRTTREEREREAAKDQISLFDLPGVTGDGQGDK